MVLSTAILVSAAISAAASIGGGIAAQAMSNKSVKDTNELNKQINDSNNSFNAEQASLTRDFDSEQAELSRQFSAQEAEKQRNWEEQMSNTQVQRRAADLQAAGFNPGLAMASQGASTPIGSTASTATARGSTAQASGFIPMRANDLSPTAQMASNLSHIVSSANSMMYLDRLAKKNPQVIANLAKTTEGVTKATTSSAKVAKLWNKAMRAIDKGYSRNIDPFTGEIS